MGEFFQKYKMLFGSLISAAVLLLAVFWGMSKGQTLAQAQTVLAAAQNAQQALQLFYRDQDRYPTAVEFSDKATMLNYFSEYPLPELPSKTCPQSFNYTRVDFSHATLSFCLPAATGGENFGWNSINLTPPPSSQ